MKKVFIILFFVLLATAGFLRFGGQKSVKIFPSPTPSASVLVAQTTIAPQQTSFGTPTRFQIPTLNVDTSIESVGMDEKGNMDVPKDPDNVAWYNLGHKIGSQGSAVIAAHFDKPDGSPAVFYSISSLQPGDKVIVTDDKNQTKTYAVEETASYPYNNFPLERVFNTTDASRLNLITCDGTWDKSKKTYSQRLVVYTKEI